MQRQGALADSSLTGADGDEMADPGKPVGDAGALLDDLLDDPGASVAGDVVVPLHRCLAYTESGGGLPGSSTAIILAPSMTRCPACGQETAILSTVLRELRICAPIARLADSDQSHAAHRVDAAAAPALA